MIYIKHTVYLPQREEDKGCSCLVICRRFSKENKCKKLTSSVGNLEVGKIVPRESQT